VKPSTSASGSQPSGNTKKDKIRRPPSSTQKNKVEAVGYKGLRGVTTAQCCGREYGRKTMQVKNPTENALIAQDRIGGYDESYQAEEEHPTNFALMALTSLGSSSNSDSEGNPQQKKYKEKELLTVVALGT
nr:hypothetical protein [Tanacetum cinerariifolium]